MSYGRPPSPSLDKFFISGDGIDRDILQRRLTRYLGKGARSRPDIYNGIKGFWIHAVQPFTSEQLKDLKRESAQYRNGADYRRDPAPRNKYVDDPPPDSGGYYSSNQDYEPLPSYIEPSNARRPTYPVKTMPYSQDTYTSPDPYNFGRPPSDNRNVPSTVYAPDDRYDNRRYNTRTDIPPNYQSNKTYFQDTSAYRPPPTDPLIYAPISNSPFLSAAPSYADPSQDPYGVLSNPFTSGYTNQAWQSHQSSFSQPAQVPQVHGNPPTEYRRSTLYGLYECPSPDCGRVKDHGFQDRQELREHLRKKHSKSPKTGSASNDY